MCDHIWKPINEAKNTRSDYSREKSFHLNPLESTVDFTCMFLVVMVYNMV